MNPLSSPTDIRSARCPRCGLSFDCGKNRNVCWCATMPKLPLDRLIAGAACLCPDCLVDEIGRARAGAMGAGGEKT